MNTKVTSILTKQIKVFQLVKFSEKIQEGRNIYFTIDESSVAFCLGTFIEDFAVALELKKIFPIYNSSPDTELNTYYLYKVYDYGKPIPKEKQGDYILFLEDEKKLIKMYKRTFEWYKELERKEDKNIINFEKIKAKRESRK